MRFRLSRTLALGVALGSLALVAGARAAHAQTDYLAFGDSITEGIYFDETNKGGYPSRLQALLTAAGVQATVKNAGLGGENTLEGLTRIDSVLAAPANASADVLLLMEGTNDIANKIGVETTRFDLNQIAIKAELKGMSVIHATVIPRRPEAKFDPDNVLNTVIVENIRDMAGFRGRDLVDNFEIYWSTPGWYEKYYYRGPIADPVGHPIAAGYDVIAQAFFNVIRKIDRVPPVVGLTVPKHGEEAVVATAPITVDVWDFGTGIDLTATTLLVNGLPVTATVVQTPPAPAVAKKVTLTYTPTTPLTGIVHLGLRTRDLATPTPNAVDREFGRYVVAGTVILPGDINRDGRVDGRDLIDLARRFGTTKTMTLYSTVADLNADTVIDGLDLALLASNFGKSSI